MSYIYFDCFTQKIDNPEGLAVRFSDRHYGIGGDGIVLIGPSEVANAKISQYFHLSKFLLLFPSKILFRL